jgi:hypothetical protein
MRAQAHNMRVHQIYRGDALAIHYPKERGLLEHAPDFAVLYLCRNTHFPASWSSSVDKRGAAIRNGVSDVILADKHR